ncbi:SAM-dependent methyltransferase [Saccharopolyspora cebuensis]|uniref:SAM-dependent methyltransferase n=1 Tax=Saccharopolyspora cebuensis TaxID=418759 RepID=A0ABV4CDD2_9PSEU
MVNAQDPTTSPWCAERAPATAPADGPPPRPMDIERPAAARLHDAFLGGSHNLGVDREFAERLAGDLPGIGELFQVDRGFLRRAVEHLLALGIRQFLDLGSGIPTIGHVHEVARRRTADLRVLYVDNEPLTVAHSSALLADEPHAAIIEADCRAPKSVLCSPAAEELLDLDRPLGLLMTSVLHFVPDADDPRGLAAEYRDALAPGSHLVLAHLADDVQPEVAAVLRREYAGTADPLHPRGTGWIEELFGDFEVLAPGAVPLADWRPDPEQVGLARRYRLMHGGVARKP